MKFKTEDTSLFNRNGQEIVILGTITEPNESFDLESLPVHLVEFPDKTQIHIWFDEIEDTTK